MTNNTTATKGTSLAVNKVQGAAITQDMIARLNPRQRSFVHHYLQTFNATESARLAGYSGSDATLAQTGSENLRKPDIAAALRRALSECGMSNEEVVARLTRIARGSFAPFLRFDDELDNPLIDLHSPSAKNNLELIKKIKVRTTKRIETDKPDGTEKQGARQITEIEIELHDPMRALEQMAKIHANAPEPLPDPVPTEPMPDLSTKEKASQVLADILGIAVWQLPEIRRNDSSESSR